MNLENNTLDFEHDFDQLLLTVLSKVQISYDRSFTENGGNSLSVLFFVAEINTRYNIDVPVELVFTYETVNQLRIFIKSRLTLVSVSGSNIEGINASDEEKNVFQGDIPLLPNRYRYFFQRKSNLNYWNVDTPVFKLSTGLSERSLYCVVQALLNCHPVLAMQLQKCENGWRQFIAAPEPDEVIELFEMPLRSDDLGFKLRVEAKMAQIQSGFKFPGTLFKVLYIKAQDSQHFVYLLMHHLLVDGYSFKLVVTNFFSLCQKAIKGVNVHLPRENVPYTQYVDLYLKHMKENEHMYFDYWQQQKINDSFDIPLKRTFDPQLNLDQYNVQVVGELSVNLVSLKGDNTNGFAHCLFRAIAKAYKTWSQSQQLFLDVAYHGRELPSEGVNLFRTVGWISEAVPFNIPLLDNKQIAASIARQMQTSATYGCGYGYLKYLSGNRQISQTMSTFPSPYISFNYVAGKMSNYGIDDVATVANEFDRFTIKPPKTQRCYLMSGGGWFEGDIFKLAWDFSEKLLCIKSVEQFTSECIAALRQEVALLS